MALCAMGEEVWSAQEHRPFLDLGAGFLVGYSGLVNGEAGIARTLKVAFV